MGFLRLMFIAVIAAVAGSIMGQNSYEENNNLVSAQLNDDVLGLIVFKSDIHDPSNFLDSWNEDDNSPCSWSFIQCNPKDGRVVELSLDNLGFSGKLGRGLEKLQSLKHLSLSQNNFNGTISPQLSFLSNLQTLNLSQNKFSGYFTDSLTTLFGFVKYLDFSHNLLSGPVPDTLFRDCTSLRYLSLAGNFLEGPIPSTLLKCTSLSNLNLSNNRFSGDPDFATGFWSLNRLRTLDLSSNALTGVLPLGVSAIHNLKELRLHKNHFYGPLPADIGLCPHLYRLDFSHNFFTDVLPESFQRLNYLSFFSISGNMINGDFPQWIVKMTGLESIDFSSNGLTGNLPLSMGDLKSLVLISLSYNKLSGNIPTSLVYCYSLSVIKLKNNGFNGSIPEKLFELGLQEVDFSGNQLIGLVPSGSSRLFESLSVLDLSNNKLVGEIPAEIGLFSNLKYFNVSWNELRSRLPPKFGNFNGLTVLDLRNSALYGPIPGDICDSGSLSILQLDGNMLDGPIPEEIGNCSSLYLLSLSQNNLNGTIPRSISQLKKLKILKLEGNELEGEIPKELGNLENLLVVNISYNRLIGRLPVGGIFNNLDESSLMGNIGICSPLLKGPCKMNVAKPLVLDPFAYSNQFDHNHHRKGRVSSSQAARFDQKHHQFLSVSAIIAISAAALIMFGVIVITLINLSAKTKLAFVDTALESMCSSSTKSANLAMGKLIIFDSRLDQDLDSISSPESLLNKATVVGTGIFGTIYKSSLGAEGGRMIAIKKLVSSNIIQNQDDFDREVRILGKARHPNLIALKGYYWTPNLQFFITDYAPNGSLEQKLHERSPSTPSLSWEDRFRIIFGTANGVAHLHHSFRPAIIHYNLKPSNILLDENYDPKISDYGLARLLTKLDQHVTKNRFQSNLGYVAPELACQSLRVNEKCDVYGFGIMILELVTGQRPVEYGEDNVVILNDHVRVMLEQGSVLECVDYSMGEYSEEEVLPVLKLALVCTSQIPSSRPSMAEIVQILQVIKTPIPNRMKSF